MVLRTMPYFPLASEFPRRPPLGNPVNRGNEAAL
jgi:hypothetical protein